MVVYVSGWVIMLMLSLSMSLILSSSYQHTIVIDRWAVFWSGLRGLEFGEYGIRAQSSGFWVLRFMKLHAILQV